MVHNYDAVAEHWTYPIQDLLGDSSQAVLLQEMKDHQVDQVWIDFVSSWIVTDQYVSIPVHDLWPKEPWPSILTTWIYERRNERLPEVDRFTSDEIDNLSNSSLKAACVSNLNLWRLARNYLMRKRSA